MSLTLRRPQLEPRIEIMPLIDVIFLLLTFFIYAMILMIPARLLPMPLTELSTAEAQQAPTEMVAISINGRGELFLDRRATTLDDLERRLTGRSELQPDLIVLIAADRRGEADRLPAFLELYDRLAPLDLDIRLVGAPQ